MSDLNTSIHPSIPSLLRSSVYAVRIGFSNDGSGGDGSGGDGSGGDGSGGEKSGGNGSGGNGSGGDRAGEDGSGEEGSGKNGSVGDRSVGNGSVAKKVAADPLSFNWFHDDFNAIFKNLLRFSDLMLWWLPRSGRHWL
jgi:hypothetical protein